MLSRIYYYFKQPFKYHRYALFFDALRYFPRWVASVGKSPFALHLPWMNFHVVDFLSREVKAGDKVFEYGCGGSSLFLTDRKVHLISVEHNKEWYDIVSKNPIENCNLHLVEPGDPEPNNPHTEYTDPLAYKSNDGAYPGLSFRAYASFIDQYPDASFDWVFIDGRARNSCLLHAMNKVKPGGRIVLDNTDRTYYTEALKEELMKLFTVELEYLGPCVAETQYMQTTIYKRKA